MPLGDESTAAKEKQQFWPPLHSLTVHLFPILVCDIDWPRFFRSNEALAMIAGHFSLLFRPYAAKLTLVGFRPEKRTLSRAGRWEMPKSFETEILSVSKCSSAITSIFRVSRYP
jgi:hypothetical protein